MNTDEGKALLQEGLDIYNEWFSMDGLAESHVRTLFHLGFLAYVDARTSIAHGLAADEGEAVNRITAILAAAAQVGRAAEKMGGVGS